MCFDYILGSVCSGFKNLGKIKAHARSPGVVLSRWICEEMEKPISWLYTHSQFCASHGSPFSVHERASPIRDRFTAETRMHEAITWRLCATWTPTRRLVHSRSNGTRRVTHRASPFPAACTSSRDYAEENMHLRETDIGDFFWEAQCWLFFFLIKKIPSHLLYLLQLYHYIPT